jgi:hypothetical protein
MGNFRIRKAELLNQNSLKGRNSTKIFFALKRKSFFNSIGHKRTSHSVGVMSALLPKADIIERDHQARFVPIAGHAGVELALP